MEHVTIAPSAVVYAPPEGTPKRSSRSTDTPVSKAACTTHLPIPGRDAVAVGKVDGTVSVWRLDDRSGEVREFPVGRHTNAVSAMVFDGLAGASGVLFSGGSDGTVRCWDPWVRDTKEACLQVMHHHTGAIKGIALGGSFLTSVASDGLVLVWRPAKARELLVYPWFELVQIIDLGKVWVTAVTMVDSETGPTMYIGDGAGTLHVFEKAFDADPGATTASSRPSTGAARLTRNQSKFAPGEEYQLAHALVKHHGLTITHLMLLQESKHLCSLSFDCTAKVADPDTGAPLIVVVNPHGVRFRSLVWNSLHQELLLSDDLGHLLLWSVYRDVLVKEHPLADNAVPCISLARDGETQRVTFVSGNQLAVVDVTRSIQFSQFKAHDNSVAALVSLDQTKGGDGQPARDARCFSVGMDNFVRCWDVYDMSELYSLRESRGELTCLLYLSFADLLVTGNEDGAIRFWNPDARSSKRYVHHNNTLSCMVHAAHRGRQYVLTGGYDGRVVVWDLTVRRALEPTVLSSFLVHEVDSSDCPDVELLCMAFIAEPEDNSQACYVTGGNDCVIRLWSIVNHALLRRLSGHTEAITCMLVVSQSLVSGGEDCSLRVWDVREPSTAEEERVVKDAHTCTVRAVDSVPGTGVIVSVAFDGCVKLWDLSSKPIAVVHEYHHDDSLTSVTVCHGHVICGSEECQLMTFPVPSAIVSALPVARDVDEEDTPPKASPAEEEEGGGAGDEEEDVDATLASLMEDEDFWARRDSWSGAPLDFGRPERESKPGRRQTTRSPSAVDKTSEEYLKLRQDVLVQTKLHMKVPP